MNALLQKNFISTKEASSLSGYNADYLSRLCRENKIIATQVGRTWLIEKSSLETFMGAQAERKIELAKNLARERELEYRKANAPVAHIFKFSNSFEKKIKSAAISVGGVFEVVSTPVVSSRVIAAGLTAAVLGISTFLVGSGLIAKAGSTFVDLAFGTRAYVIESATVMATQADKKHARLSLVAEEEIASVSRIIKEGTDARIVNFPVSLHDQMARAHDSVELTALAYAHARDIASTYPRALTTREIVASVEYSASHPSETFNTIAQASLREYVGIGAYALNDIEQVLTLYIHSIESAGEGLLTVGEGVRTASVNGPLVLGTVFVEASERVFALYESAVYAYVEHIEEVPRTMVGTVYNLGNLTGATLAATITEAPGAYNRSVIAFVDRTAFTANAVSESSFAFGGHTHETVTYLLNAEDRAIAGAVQDTVAMARTAVAAAIYGTELLAALPSEMSDTGLGVVGGIALQVEAIEADSLSASPLASIDFDRFVPGFFKNLTAVLARAAGSAFHGIFGPLAGFFGASEEVGLAIIPGGETSFPGPAGAPTEEEAIKGNPIYNGPVTIIRNEYPSVTYGGVSQAYVDDRFNLLRRTLYNRIEDVADDRTFRGAITNSTIEESSIVDSTISNSTFTGGSISGSALDVATTTVTGTLTVNGDLSVSGSVIGNSTTTNATSTNLYSENLAFENLFGTNATITNATTTNFFAATLDATLATIVDAFFTNLTATLATITNAVITNLTATDATFTNATSTNATTTGSFALSYVTPARLLSVGANGIVNSTNISSWITGTLNQLTVTDNGTGGVSLSLPSTIVIGTTAPTTISSDGATSTFGGGVRATIIEASNYLAGPYILATSTTATSAFSGNIAVGRNATFGTSAVDTLTVTSSIDSDLVPHLNNTHDLGTPAYNWSRIYVDEVVANNISAADTTIGGTADNDFYINSDNASNDLEDIALVFDRGIATPNATITWNSVAKRFEFNLPIFSDDATLTNATTTNLTTTDFSIDSSTFTSLLGSGLLNVGGALTLDRTGAWTGTFDGQEGSYYLARANHTGTQTASTISDFSSTARGLFSSTATGLTYTSGTGVFSLTGGYTIPLSASTTEWSTFYDTPSTRIIAGSGVGWTGNTLSISTSSLSSSFFEQGGNSFGATAVLGTNDSNSLSFETGGTTRLTIDTSGNIGVGTSTPAVTFDIFGTDALRLPTGTSAERPSGDIGYVRYNITTHQFEGYGDNSVWQGLGGVIDADQDTYITADTNNTDEDTLRLFTAGAERLSILPNGNVGVGTTTPYAKLSVTGDLALTGGLYDSTATRGTSGMVLQTTGTGTQWVATSTLGFLTTSSFDTSAELAAILSDETGTGSVVFSAAPTLSGAVSVSSGGTISLASNGFLYGAYQSASFANVNLKVNYAANLAGVSVANRLAGVDTYARSEFSGSAAALTASANYASVMFGSSTVQEAASSNHPLLANVVVKPITVTNQAGTVTNTASLYIEGAATATVSGANLALWVDDGNAVFDGNVGVGIANPSTKLVVGNGYTEPTVGGISSSTYAIFSNNNVANGTSTISILARSSAVAGINFGSQSTERAGFIDYGFTGSQFGMAMGTAGVERLRISGTGSVGVGTTTPAGQLAVTAATNQTHGLYVQAASSVSSPNVYAGYFTNTSLGVTGLSVGVYGNAAGSAGSWSTRGVSGESDADGVGVYGVAGVGVSGNGTASGVGVYGGTASNGVGVYAAGNGTGHALYATGAKSYFGDSVGIGTTSPQGLLHLAETSTSGNSLIIEANGASAIGAGVRLRHARGTVSAPTNIGAGDTTGFIAGQAYSGGSFLSTAEIDFLTESTSFTSGQRPASAISFYTNPANGSQTERLRIDSAGNVGIGTTAPGDKLHVYDATGSVGNPTIRLESLAGGYGSGVEAGSIVTGGSYLAMGKAVWDGEGTWNTTVSTQDSYFTVHTTQNGTLAEKMRISSSGNVGIGTNAPDNKLSISGSVAGDVAAQVINLAPGSVATPYTSSLLLGGYQASNKAKISALEQSQNTAASQLTFSVANASNVLTEYMRINGATGNVGIGTDPNYKLQLLGTGQSIALNNGTSATNGGGVWSVGLGSGAIDGGLGNYSAILGGAANNDIIVSAQNSNDLHLMTIGANYITLNTATTERMRITAAGNVGIGTTADRGKLHVITATDTAPNTVSDYGTRHVVFGPGIADGLAFSKTTAGSAYITSARPGTAWDALAIQASTFSFNPNGGTSAFHVTNAGNVGIGTTNPLQKLVVTGGANGFEFLPGATGSFSTIQVYDRVAGSYGQMLIDAATFTVRPNGTAMTTVNTSGFTVANLVSCAGVQTNGSGLMSCTSDERLKDVESEFTTGLAGLRGITPQTYTWKEGTPYFDNGVSYSGFIAQNVGANIPEAMNEGAHGYKQISTTAILAASVNAIKELDTRTLSLAPAEENAAAKNLDVSADAHVAGLLTVAGTGTFIGGLDGSLATFAENVTAAAFLTQADVSLPEEVYTAGSADLYKMASYAIANIQGLSERTDLIIERLDTLEQRLAMLEQAAPALPSLLELPPGTLERLMASVGIAFEGGITSIEKLAAGKLTIGSAEKPMGVTFYDERTGEPYCLSIRNGNQHVIQGECEVGTPTQPDTTPILVSPPPVTEPVGGEVVVPPPPIQNPAEGEGLQPVFPGVDETAPAVDEPQAPEEPVTPVAPPAPSTEPVPAKESPASTPAEVVSGPQGPVSSVPKDLGTIRFL